MSDSALSQTSLQRFGLIAGSPGPCAVAMWQVGSPAGTCGKQSYGEQYDRTFLPPHFGPNNRPPLAMGYCCEVHGGPPATGTRFMRDGDMWCAFRPDFENLQESIAGFGPTQVAAFDDMAMRIANDITARQLRAALAKVQS
jgi:hypothetical protein